MVSRVHKRGGVEYLTLTIPSTNALHKVRLVYHQILSFCIDTFRVTKDLMIGVNSSSYIDINIISFMWASLTS